MALINESIWEMGVERYGDVQAFGLNAAAANPANWSNPTEQTPLVQAMNGYMTGYGVYQLMVLVSPEGKLLAVNTVGPTGKPLDTKGLYGKSFAGEKWLTESLAGKFLDGDGLTGTNVTDAHFNGLIDSVYQSKNTYSLIFAAPVKDNQGKTVAVWANYADFSLVEDIVATFYEDFKNTGNGRTEITLLDKSGTVIVDFDPAGQNWTKYLRNPEVIGKVNLVKLKVEAAINAVAKKSGTVEEVLHARKKINQAAGYAHTRGGYNYPGLGWSALIRAPVEETYSLWDNTILAMWVALGSCAAAVLALGFIVGRSFALPISNMTAAMAALASGNVETEVPAKDRGDEIGQMAQTVQVFKDNAIEMRRLEGEQKQAEARAKENEKQAEEEKRRMMYALADDFQSNIGGVVQRVASAATELQSSSESMSSIAEATMRQTADVTTVSQQSSSNVETMAAAAEELSSSVAEISRQVAESSAITSSAVAEAEKANAIIRGLVETSDKVGEVINLITDIAEQTNLLALNATIEAARAGEAGKGFAVVASEVKNLANQTAKATDEISAQISGIREATQNSVQAIDSITKIIERIDEISSTIASAVEEQGTATQEIAQNADQAAKGTAEVSSSISEVSQAAGETGEAARQIKGAATELSEQSEALRRTVDEFLAQIRAS